MNLVVESDVMVFLVFMSLVTALIIGTGARELVNSLHYILYEIPYPGETLESIQEMLLFAILATFGSAILAAWGFREGCVRFLGLKKPKKKKPKNE